MKKTVDVAIIGGGIIGNTIAFFLAKEGLSIALYEAEKISSGTTKAAAGMLGAHSEYIGNNDFYSFARESQNLYWDVKTEVEELSGIEFELATGGILQYQYNPSKNALHSAGRHLTANEIKQAIPYANVPEQGGILFKEDIHVHPEQTCKAFSKAAQSLGVNLYEHTAVRSIQNELITTEDGSVAAKNIVVTAGIGSQTLLPLKMSTVKGQCLKLNGEGVNLPYTLFYEGTYMLQRADNSIVVGATMEFNYHKGITEEGEAQLLNIAENFLHQSSRLPILDQWYGFRPKTVDDLPYIGKMPGENNVYIATGHFRNGILLAPATAKMITDLIKGNAIPKERLHIFDPQRGLGIEV